MSDETTNRVDKISTDPEVTAEHRAHAPAAAIRIEETVVHRPAAEQRLNPFAFPAETNVRFNLLVFALVILTVDLTATLLTLVSYGQIQLFNVEAIDLPETTADNFETAAPRILSALLKWLGDQAIPVLLIALVLVVLLGAAYLLYRSHPRHLWRSRRFHGFPAGKDAKFRAEVQSLAALAGVSPTPEIVVGEKSPPADGQVFGFKGRYSVRLGARMPLVMRKYPAMFRGTVLHEMAHIANGDVGRAYFSQSMWGVALALVILPFVLVYAAFYARRLVGDMLALLSGSSTDLLRLATVDTPTFIWVIAQLAGLVALSAAIRASLLRAREIYADWRAALWGAGDGLEAIFRENEGQRKPSGWSRLWRLHPDPQLRLRLLRNPRALFGIPNDLPLLVGALVGASVPGFLGLTTVLAVIVATASAAVSFGTLQENPSSLVVWGIATLSIIPVGIMAFIGPMYVLTYLTAGSLGLQAQRDGVAAMAMQERRGLTAYFRLIIPAALYAVGLQIGFLLVPANLFSRVGELIDYQGDILSLVLAALATLLWLVITTVLIWLWLAWGRYTARRWMGRQTGPKPPDRRRRFLTIYLALILWLLMIPLLLSQAMSWNAVTHLGGTFTTELTAVVIVIGLGLAAVAAGAGWLLVVVTSSGSITCPACERKTKQRHAVGRSCEHCGADLAPWIIAQPGQV